MSQLNVTNKIISIKKNCMGTVDLIAKFNGMRKEQDFIVYPIKAGETPDHILIQSSTRIGRIFLNTGVVTMSKSVQSGAYSFHLAFATEIDRVSAEDLSGIKFRILQTASLMAGNNGVMFCDNSGAENVSIFQAV